MKRNTTNMTASREAKVFRKVENNESVTILNATYGEVGYTSKKTGMSFTMLELGDTVDIDFDELKTIKASHPKYLTYPYIVITGENADDVIHQLGLEKAYENYIMPDDIDYVLNEMPLNEFKELFKATTEGMKLFVVKAMRKHIEDGTFDSFGKIQVVEDIMGISIIDK